MATKLKPGETWTIKHVVAKKYHESGQPRDIVGIYDMRYVEDPHLRARIRELEKRDEQKYFGTKEYNYLQEKFPPEVEMPNNQARRYYEIRAFEAARIHEHGNAYWYFMKAAQKTKIQNYSARKRLMNAAESNLKAWRVSKGYC